VTQFIFLVAQDISGIALARDFKFGVHVDCSKSQPMDDKLSLKGLWSLSCDFNFWKISDNISKKVYDSLIVSIKFVFLVIVFILL